MGQNADDPEVIAAAIDAIEKTTGRKVTRLDLRLFITRMQEAYYITLMQEVMGKGIEDEG